MLNKIIFLFVLSFLIILTPTTKAAPLKYIFLFIGDGMGHSHVHLADMYLNNISNDKKEKLLMTKFPIHGIISTHSANKHITDSPASVTAFATGEKTNNRLLSISPEGEILQTITEKLSKKGWLTGLLSTKSVTDATIAGFFAHQVNRENHYNIATQLANSKADFILGGGAKYFLDNKNGNLKELLYKNGFTSFFNVEETENFLSTPYQEDLKLFGALYNKHLPLTINTPQKRSLLVDGLKKAISIFKQKKKPFFIMAEGALIDTASHSHDLPAMLTEVLDFNQAIKIAYNFYKKHPHETLIIVTADHETGGLILNSKSHNYKNINFEQIKKIKASFLYNKSIQYDGNKKKFLETLKKYFALIPKNENEKNILNRAMLVEDTLRFASWPIKMFNRFIRGIKQTHYHYSTQCPYGPTMNVVNEIVTERANISWGTFHHTAATVPIFSIGNSSEEFQGSFTNDEIGRKLFKLTKNKY
jgi:alkaline phosphatase